MINKKILFLTILISVCYLTICNISAMAQGVESIPKRSVIYGPADNGTCLRVTYAGNVVVSVEPLDTCDSLTPGTPLVPATFAAICYGTPRTDRKNCYEIVSAGEIVANKNPYIWIGGRVLYVPY